MKVSSGKGKKKKNKNKKTKTETGKKKNKRKVWKRKDKQYPNSQVFLTIVLPLASQYQPQGTCHADLPCGIKFSTLTIYISQTHQ
jgi:hypothetical protein